MSGEFSTEKSNIVLPPDAENVIQFSGKYGVVTAREREWNAIVSFLQSLKGANVRELTAAEFENSNGVYERGSTLVVRAGTANTLLRLIEPYGDLVRRAGRDTTVLLGIDDTGRQREILESEDWPQDFIQRFEVGHLPDWPEE